MINDFDLTTNVAEFIQQYESNTFSGSRISNAHAKRMAKELINILLDQYVDGSMLDEIAENTNEKN